MAKPAKKNKDLHDPMFSLLVQEVTKAIEVNSLDGRNQRERFEELVTAERLFHKTMLEYKISNEMYKKFIQQIRLVNKNILSGRPYFRESSETFSSQITPALKASDPKLLREFGINYHFVIFCKKNWIGLWPKKLEEIFKRIEKARNILVESNMPLAINRAKIFYRKVPKGHLSFMDMIESAAMGLCAGIDKYVGEFKPNFIGVCIGRIVGNLIDIYSETQLHFYPNDRRILYRANSIRGRQGITDIAELTEAVNASFVFDLSEGRTAPDQVSISELSNLMAASSLVSADSNPGEEGFGVYSYIPDEAESVEEVLEKKQDIRQMIGLAQKLPIINKKVLKLKGIDI